MVGVGGSYVDGPVVDGPVVPSWPSAIGHLPFSPHPQIRPSPLRLSAGNCRYLRLSAPKINFKKIPNNQPKHRALPTGYLAIGYLAIGH
jgi:hypothetical protein